MVEVEANFLKHATNGSALILLDDICFSSISFTKKLSIVMGIWSFFYFLLSLSFFILFLRTYWWGGFWCSFVRLLGNMRRVMDCWSFFFLWQLNKRFLLIVYVFWFKIWEFFKLMEWKMEGGFLLIDYWFCFKICDFFFLIVEWKLQKKKKVGIRLFWLLGKRRKK